MEVTKKSDTLPAYRIMDADGKITVKAPYNKNFVKAAQALGGRWNGVERVWQFSASMADDVKKICRAVYEGPAVEDQQQRTQSGISKAVGKAAEKVMQALPPTKVAAMAYKGVVFGAQVTAFGMNGMRGVSYAGTVLGGTPKKLRPSGISTNYSLGMEERERGLQQGLSR